MTLYYAVGGGLGHVTRARRVLAALQIADATVLSSADLPAELEGKPDAHREWLIERVRGHRVLVDAFPAGIQGELSGTEGVAFDYVARLLDWPAYRAAVPQPLPRFGRTYLVETLTPEHERFVAQSGGVVVPLTLAAPISSASPSVARPYTLVVHSGPAAEVEELVAYARELGSERLLVATRCEMASSPGCERIDTNEPWNYFDGATRIVSAAGFNVMLETEPWRYKHHVLPFPRRFDDQFLRAARRKQRLAAQLLTAPAASSSAQRA